MSPKIVNRERKRRDILRAAIEVVGRRGIRNVTMAEIARTAGMGKATIYEYFSGKEEVYGATIQEYLDRAGAAVAKEMFRARGPREKLSALLGGWLRSTVNESDELIMLFLDVWTEAIRGTGTGIGDTLDLRAFFQEYRELVASILQEGIDAGELRPMDTETVAGGLLAAVDGVLLQWLLDRDNVDVVRAADTLVDIFWNGIRAR